MTACHFNAHSLSKNFNLSLPNLSKFNYDIITVSETWLSDVHTDKMFSINGYTLIRNSRAGRSGGVAIYLKKSLKFKVISCSSSRLDSPSFEYIFCEVSLKNSDLFVAVVNRPPKAPYFKDSTFLSIYPPFALTIAANSSWATSIAI